MPQKKGCSFLNEPRLVARKFLARPQIEGVGAVVRRSIGRFELKYFDPFIVLDEFSGFETCTIFCLIKGVIMHEDFEGHKGTIEAGDLQWMTAGRGIVHSEMPGAQGIHSKMPGAQGTQRGLQLWINLASKYKMIEPRYQEVLSKDIAEAEDDGIKVRVIAGEALGIKSPIYTRTPTMFLDFTLKPGGHLQQPIPKSWNAFVYVLEGEGIFGNMKSQPSNSHHILLLGAGDGLEAWNQSSKLLRFILVGAEPLGEPLVQFGPFVMNTQEEIDQTIDDFENFANGFEKARHWRSESQIN
ncbi:Pirin-like protein [Glycine soja]